MAIFYATAGSRPLIPRLQGECIDHCVMGGGNDTYLVLRYEIWDKVAESGLVYLQRSA